MFKKLRDVTQNLTDEFAPKARKSLRKLNIETSGTQKGLITAGALGGVAALSFLIPPVGATIVTTMAVAGAGYTTAAGINADVDKKLQSWTNMAGQQIQGRIHYFEFLQNTERQMLKYGHELNTTTDQKRIDQLHSNIESLRTKISDVVDEVVVIVPAKGEEELYYKILDTEALQAEAKKRFQPNAQDQKKAKPFKR